MRVSDLPRWIKPILKQEKSGPLIESAIYGLFASLSVVFFEVSITWLFNATLVPLSKQSHLVFLIGSFLIMAGTSAISGFLLNVFAPEAAGSGIPQLKAAFWKEFGYIPLRVVWVKYLAGVLSVGGGCSLGREGPSVQLAGALASNVAGWLGVAKSGRRRSLAAGAAAGLAAAFNTPLSAVAFVLEEVLGDLNSPLLGSVVVASIVGALVVHAFLGGHPAFPLPAVEGDKLHAFPLVPVVAVLSAGLGVLFQRATLGLRLAFRSGWLRVIPGWLRPVLGAILTWMLGASVFLYCGRLAVFSLGYADLADGLNGGLGGPLPLLLLLTKGLATVFSFGSGGCGGIFAQCLFFGAMVGDSVNWLAQLAGYPLSHDEQVLLMIVGMSACLGAVIRAPLTSILIVFEMTRQFSIVPALLLAGILSQAVARWLIPHGFYEQILRQDGHEISTVRPPRDFKEWLNYPVSAIANFQPVFAQELHAQALRDLLQNVPYNRFPVHLPGKSPGVIIREEVERALKAGVPVEPLSVPTCLRSEVIRVAQDRLVESNHGLVLVLDKEGGQVVGLMTLHDLLRAQQTLSERAAA